MNSLRNHLADEIVVIAFVVLCCLISCIGLYLFQKRIPAQSLKPIHDVTGILYGATSLIYSLILAFVIVAVWDNYEEISSDVDGETNKLENILLHANELPDSLRLPVVTLVAEYAKTVVTNWHSANAKQQESNSSLTSLRLSLFHLRSSTDKDQQVLNYIHDELTDAMEFRRNRLTHLHSHVPELVWAVLIVGSVITVLFSFFFSVQPLSRHYFFVIMLTCMVSLSLYLVFALDHPFDGSSEVSSHPFIELYSN